MNEQVTSLILGAIALVIFLVFGSDELNDRIVAADAAREAAVQQKQEQMAYKAHIRRLEQAAAYMTSFDRIAAK